MDKAKDIFVSGIDQTKQETALYDHFIKDLKIPHNDVSDILRFQIVYAVSGFDRLLHELIRVGVIEMFRGTRIKTSKFLGQQFRADTLLKAIEYSKSSNIPSSPQETIEYIVNKEMYEKLGYLSFQSPDKVKDGLSLIWDEPRKLLSLAKDIGMTGGTDNDKQKILEQKLTLLVDRRNQIAHEGDIDPSTNMKRDITKQEALEAIQFIEQLGLSIYKFVTDSSCYV